MMVMAKAEVSGCGCGEPPSIRGTAGTSSKTSRTTDLSIYRNEFSKSLVIAVVLLILIEDHFIFSAASA